jgi:hypothetical protein
VIDPISQVIYVTRFLCYMAVIYLALHKLVARLSTRPNSKLLWFFSVLTAPLTRPVRLWFMPGASDDRLLSGALFFYALLWLCLVLLDRIASGAPR